MRTKTRQIWPELVMLIMFLALLGCGSSNSVSTAPLGDTTQGSGLVGAPRGAPSNFSAMAFGYDDGTVQYWDGTATSSFSFLPAAPAQVPVITMKAYDDISGNHFLAVLFTDNSLAQFDGNVWTTVKTGAVTQIAVYQNSLIIVLSDGSVLQYANRTLNTLHPSSGWSGVSKISTDNNFLIVGLKDGEIVQWNSVDNSWTSLGTPEPGQSLWLMIVYGTNSGHPMVALTTNTARLWRYDGAGWTNLLSPFSQLTQLVAFDNANSSGQSDFLLANNYGHVYLAASDGTFPDVFTVEATDSVTQLIEYRGTVIAGTPSGHVLQATRNSDGKFTQQTIAGDGWNSTISQIVIDEKNNLLVRRTDGGIEKWNGNGGWNEVLNKQWSTPLAQIAPYNGTAVMGFEDGSIQQWNGCDNKIAWQGRANAGIAQMVKWGGLNAVIVANNGYVFTASSRGFGWVHGTQSLIYFDGSPQGYDSGRLDVLGNGALMLSASTNNNYWVNSDGDVAGHYQPLSAGLIQQVNTNDPYAVDWIDIAKRYTTTDSTLGVDSIVQTAADPDAGTFFASYGDGMYLMADGNSNDSTRVIFDPGWIPAADQMKVYHHELFVGAQDGAVYLFDGIPFMSTSWSKVHNSWGARVTQMTLYNGKVIFGLSNGAVEQCDGNCNVDGGGWSELTGPGSGSRVNQLLATEGSLFVGLANGVIARCDGDCSSGWTQLHGSSGRAPVIQLGFNSGSLFVGLQNGAVHQWDGTKWNELSYSHTGALTQMIVM